jgi:hypothetical protein
MVKYDRTRLSLAFNFRSHIRSAIMNAHVDEIRGDGRQARMPLVITQFHCSMYSRVHIEPERGR